MFIIIFYSFLIPVSANNFTWSKIDYSLFVKGVKTVNLKKQGNILLSHWTYQENDSFLPYQETLLKNGISLSVDNGINWTVLLENYWEIDKNNLEESLIEKRKLKQINDINLSVNKTIFISLSQGYLLRSTNLGSNFDTTYMGLLYDNNKKDTSTKVSQFNIILDNQKNNALYHIQNTYSFYQDNIFTSTNNGEKWDKFDFDYSALNTIIPEESIGNGYIDMISHNIFIFKFFDKKSKLINGYNEFYITKDRGKTYNKIKLPDSLYEYHYNLFYKDSLEFYLSGYYEFNPNFYDLSPYIYRSSDGGKNWIKVFESNWFPDPPFQAMFLESNNDLLISAFKILRTTNNGHSWTIDKDERPDSLTRFVSNYAFNSKEQNIIKDNKGNFYEAKKTTNVKNINLMTHFFSLYPNPVDADKKLTIKFYQHYPENIELYDLNGNLLLNNAVLFQDEIVLDISSFIPGTYLVKANYGSQSLSRKFIKK